MRLAHEEEQIIRAAVLARDPGARVLLFGSRTDDAARGGDLDVFVVSDRITFRDEWGIRRDILDQLGWQRLDLVVRTSDHLNDALARHVLDTGVPL